MVNNQSNGADFKLHQRRPIFGKAQMKWQYQCKEFQKYLYKKAISVVKAFTIKDILTDLQAFCIEFSKVSDVSKLFKLVKGQEPQTQ